MNCAVAADETSAIKAESYWQTLQRSFLKCLIECALKEGRIDREERLPASLCQAGHHVECVAFADAAIPNASWEFIDDFVDSSSIWHRSGACDNLGIALHERSENFAEGSGERAAAFLHLDFASFVLHRFNLESTWRMESACVIFSELITLAFDGLDMQNHRMIKVLRFVEEIDECRKIVSVDRSNRDKSEMFEPMIFSDESLG